MSKHTPVPYSVFSHLGYCPECGAREDPAKVKAQRDELLEALKYHQEQTRPIERTRAAIKKAEGQE